MSAGEMHTRVRCLVLHEEAGIMTHMNTFLNVLRKK